MNKNLKDFQLKKEVRKNYFFFKLTFMAGDADAYEYHEFQLHEINMNNYSDEYLESYKEYFQNIADAISLINDSPNGYKVVEETYGEKIASWIDGCVPYDITSNDRKCKLDKMEICYYDNEGNLFCKHFNMYSYE